VVVVVVVIGAVCRQRHSTWRGSLRDLQYSLQCKRNQMGRAEDSLERFN
jgi:hypothetical protein